MNLPVSTCYACGKMLDAATPLGPDGSPPEPGSISFCIECGSVMVFDECCALRAPTNEERKSLAADEEFLQLERAVRQSIRALKEKTFH